MDVVFTIFFMLCLIIFIILIIDNVIFRSKTSMIETGMTGKEIQERTGLKVIIVSVQGNVYYARIQSKLTLFSYRLAFSNGRLVSKQRGR